MISEAHAGRPADPIPADDPYPSYRRLHEQGPVHWREDLGAFFVVSYDEAAEVLRGSGWSSDPRNSPELTARLGGPETASGLFAKMLLFMDAPEHGRLRRLVAPSFTPRGVEGLRPRVASVVDAALAALAGADSFDVVSELAYPVPLAVIAELLDVGADGAELLRVETPKLAGMLELDADPKTLADAAEGSAGLAMFLLPILADRRRHPGGDFVSALLAADEQGERLDLDEALATCLLLLVAGHETTAGLVGNGLLALLNHPDQLELLRRRPHLARSAVEELLRFDSPVQRASRIARTDHVLGGHRIQAGRQVLVLLGAANRDPRHFPDPDRLDITRQGAPSLAFGSGPHFCLGAALARLEAQEILVRLVDRFPGLRLDGSRPPSRRPTTALRALRELPVLR
ncbi:MAG: cytochrome P450 [Streptosporangiales bacterium]|nr:cytochrome P450 [Streptosporangiales bacterium]